MPGCCSYLARRPPNTPRRSTSNTLRSSPQPSTSDMVLGCSTCPRHCTASSCSVRPGRLRSTSQQEAPEDGRQPLSQPLLELSVHLPALQLLMCSAGAVTRTIVADPKLRHADSHVTCAAGPRNPASPIPSSGAGATRGGVLLLGPGGAGDPSDQYRDGVFGPHRPSSWAPTPFGLGHRSGLRWGSAPPWRHRSLRTGPVRMDRTDGP